MSIFESDELRYAALTIEPAQAMQLSRFSRVIAGELVRGAGNPQQLTEDEMCAGVNGPLNMHTTLCARPKHLPEFSGTELSWMTELKENPAWLPQLEVGAPDKGDYRLYFAPLSGKVVLGLNVHSDHMATMQEYLQVPSFFSPHITLCAFAPEELGFKTGDLFAMYDMGKGTHNPFQVVQAAIDERLGQMVRDLSPMPPSVRPLATQRLHVEPFMKQPPPVITAKPFALPSEDEPAPISQRFNHLDRIRQQGNWAQDTTITTRDQGNRLIQ